MKELACPGRGHLDAEGNFFLKTEHHKGCKDPFLADKAIMREGLFEESKKKLCNPIDIYKAVAKK